MTPQDVITEVRRLIQDESAPLRYSDTVLLGFVNQTLKRMAVLRPDLFTVIANVNTTANVITQTLPAGSTRLVEVFAVASGAAVEEVDRDLFNRAYPSWSTDPAGTPTKYMRHPRNPTSYFLYPRPQAGVQMLAEYVVWPINYTLAQSITAPSDAYFASVVDGTVFLAESIDNEHVNTGRAKLFYDSFMSGLGASLSSRAITDTEDAGLFSPPSERAA